MKDKVAAKRKGQKAKSEPTEGGGSGGTNGIPPKTPESSGDGSGPEKPDQTPQKPKRDLWGFFAEILSPIIIAVMTIVITGVTYYQWTATVGQLGEMKRAADQLDGLETIYFQGCFIYETFGMIRQSRFCFYWINEVAKNPSEWEWRFCPSGNDGN